MSFSLATYGFGTSEATGGAGGAGADLDNPSPPAGSILHSDRGTARHTPISFQVLDGGVPVDSSTTPWCIWIKYLNDDRGYIIYDSATGFMPPFASRQSSWVAATATMTVLPDGGWQDTIQQICVGGNSDANIVPVRNGATGSDPPPNAP